MEESGKGSRSKCSPVNAYVSQKIWVRMIELSYLVFRWLSWLMPKMLFKNAQICLAFLSFKWLCYKDLINFKVGCCNLCYLKICISFSVSIIQIGTNFYFLWIWAAIRGGCNGVVITLTTIITMEKGNNGIRIQLKS